jgi:alpha-L-fucosidase
MLNKRDLLKQGSALAALSATPALGQTLAPGPFKPDWDSLKSQYHAPDWFRDAKFGIWAHWSAQCVPEAGD